MQTHLYMENQNMHLHILPVTCVGHKTCPNASITPKKKNSHYTKMVVVISKSQRQSIALEWSHHYFFQRKTEDIAKHCTAMQLCMYVLTVQKSRVI